MTGYAAMAARGREESRERTTGRRKREAVRIESRPAVGAWLGGWNHDLIGSCGHVLAFQHTYGPEPHSYLTSRLGRRITCEHDDCRIPPKPEVPDAERCEAVDGTEVERRCPTRARYDTAMGRACRKHRNRWIEQGYIDNEGSAR